MPVGPVAPAKAAEVEQRALIEQLDRCKAVGSLGEPNENMNQQWTMFKICKTVKLRPNDVSLLVSITNQTRILTVILMVGEAWSSHSQGSLLGPVAREVSRRRSNTFSLSASSCAGAVAVALQVSMPA